MEVSIPHVLPVLALAQNSILYPSLVLRLQMHSKESVALMQQLYRQPNPRAIVACMPYKSAPEDKNQKNGLAATLPTATDTLSDQKSDKIDSTQVIVPGTTAARTRPDQLYDYGCAARIVRLERTVGGGYQVVVEGLARIRAEKYVQETPYMEIEVTVFPEIGLVHNPSSNNLLASLKNAAREMISLLSDLKLPPLVLKRLQAFIANVDNSQAGALADLMVSSVEANYAEKLQILKIIDVKERCEKVVDLVSRQVDILKVSQKVHKNVDSKLSKKQREFYLRQQLNAIREELGEGDNGDKEEDDVTELQHRLNDAGLSPEAAATAKRELKRLKRMNPMMGEYQICRTYLEWLADLPWSKSSDDGLDAGSVDRARKQLEADHYGLEKIKKRLLEYLAVVRLRRLSSETLAVPAPIPEPASAGLKTNIQAAAPPQFRDKGPILLFVGPPGTGKTSIAKSLATALGRKFHRISLGGVRDEAEIRGHRRTYIGAMPGLLVQALKKVQVNNPVILLDEIDKISGNNFHGDPSAAMLEVLDPEQNVAFNDHYVNVPIDLSQVLFIATANTLDTIAPPLLDRMEVINLPGYTFQEKLHIAQRYLLPKQIKGHGLSPDQVVMDSDVVIKVATGYTREAGVRNLEREIASVCRVKAVEYAECKDSNKLAEYSPRVRVEDLETILGVEKFDDEVAQRHSRPGVVTGLAYMGSGNGGIMFIEASQMPGKGDLHLTGKLGDVIKESAHIALSWVKAHAYDLGLTNSPSESLLKNRDVHLHMPAGAVPKDGPSAGVALVICLVSLFSSKRIPPTLAMTGEISLRGLVLPVGGIKEKTLAAHRAGIKKVMLPKRNRKDVESGDLPLEVVGVKNAAKKTDSADKTKEPLEFVYVENVAEALQVAFEDVGGIGRFGPGGKWQNTVMESRL